MGGDGSGHFWTELDTFAGEGQMEHFGTERNRFRARDGTSLVLQKVSHFAAYIAFVGKLLGD